jgi:lipopolysaccharide transport system ATP-binding protein
MDPQILLADEILAVGDQVFQERCLERVAEAGRQGLTVLFVSHDMDAILRVCNRVIWINGGEVIRDGEPEAVVDEYQQATWARADAIATERGRRANRMAAITAVRLVNASGREIGGAPTDEDVYVKILLNALRRKQLVRPSIDVTTRGHLLFRASDDTRRLLREEGLYEILVRLPANLLAETTYTVSINLLMSSDREGAEYPLTFYNALTFMAYSSEQHEETIVSGNKRLERAPLIAPRLEWAHRKIEDAVSA